MMRPCAGCRAVFEPKYLKSGRCLPCRSRLGRERNARRPVEMALYSSAAWQQLGRQVVMAAGGRCHWCGSVGRKLTADHVVTVRQRPDLGLEPSNVVAACRSCQLQRQYAPGGGRHVVA